MLRSFCVLAVLGLVGVVVADDRDPVEKSPGEVTDAVESAVQPEQAQESVQSVRMIPEQVDPLWQSTQAGSSRPSEDQRGATSSQDQMGPPAPIFDADSARISFQALLTDAGGDPLAGNSVNLTFSIYEFGGGPLVQGPIIQNNVPMNNGVVNTQIAVNRSSFDGSGRELGVSVNGGAQLSPRTALTAVPYAYRVDRVASAELDDQIELGDASANGRLGVWSNNFDLQAVELDGFNHWIRTFGIDGLEQVRLWGGGFGEIYLYDGSVTNDLTVTLAATSNSGGELRLRDATAAESIFADGGDGTVNAEGRIRHVASIGGTEYASLGANGSGGGVLRTNDETGAQTLIMGSIASGGGGFMNMHIDGSIWPGVQMFGGSAGVSGGGEINVLEDSDVTNIQLSAPGHRISTYGEDGLEQVRLWGPSYGEVILHDASATNDTTVVLRANSDSGGELILYDRTGATALAQLEAHEGAGAGGAQLALRNAAGVATIVLDADQANTGEGRIIADVVQITGGADFSEQFDIKSDGVTPEPGMVVSIDPTDPGRLVVSSKAYDRTVAGIISGANGISTGMLMGQRGSVADGQLPVALTGRVYCYADASHGAIQPGDLLTTSDVPGHAMKVTDHQQAQGAIIGKAMSSLNEGKGLVLVLVSLQ